MDELIRDRELHEECGVFGVFGVPNASSLTYYGLHALQHRGQEGAGIVCVDDGVFRRVKGEGLVTEVFKEEALRGLTGDMAIGHVRYATTGGGGIENVQPFMFRHNSGDFALAHNGNLVNSVQLRDYLENKGSLFQSSSDSEVLAHLIKKETRSAHRPRIHSIVEALNMIEGAFAFLIMTANRIYACRDKYGLRPLSIGRLGDGYVVSSETCAFEVIGAEFVRDVAPGEIVTIDRHGLRSTDYSMYKRHQMCAMEYIYFARPDSDIESCNVHAFRKETGRLLFEESHVDADIVVGVPDSSLSAAMGYAEASPGLQPGLRHPLRHRPHQKQVHRPHLHPALAGAAREGRADEARARTFDRAGQARDPNRRLGGARHHVAAYREDAARGGCPRGAPAHRVAAADASVFLRGRYFDLRGAALRPQEPRRGARADRLRHAGVPLEGGALQGGRPFGAVPGLLHGALSHGALPPHRGGQQGRQVLTPRRRRAERPPAVRGLPLCGRRPVCPESSGGPETRAESGTGRMTGGGCVRSCGRSGGPEMRIGVRGLRAPGTNVDQ